MMKATVPTRGSILEVEGLALEPGGETTARADAGQGVHEDVELRVTGMLPGERGRVRVTHVGRRGKRLYAELQEVLSPAAGRRQPPCRHQGRCGGCPLMVAELPLQHSLKRARLAELGLEVARIEADAAGELGYRWSSKRVVGGRAGHLVLGSYRPGSHQLADMEGCLVDHPDIVACLTELRRQAEALGVVPYDEAGKTGDLRYVWLKTDGAGKVLLTLISASAHTRAAELAARLERPAGVAWAVQDAAGNAIRGMEPTVLRGDGALEIRVAGEATSAGPLGFLQPNPTVAGRAYRDLVQGPGTDPARGQLAWDLYAGAGITTGLLRQRFGQVEICEAYPESAALLGVAPSTAEAFLAAQLRGESRPALVVANPPRAGLGEAVCSSLVELGRRQQGLRLHLMSCAPRALAADLARLADAFDVEELRAYDTLPQTAHIELVAWLRAR